MNQDIKINGLYMREKHIQWQGGEFDVLDLSIDVQAFREEMQIHSKEVGGKPRLKLKFKRLKQPTESGITHRAVLDTYEPTNKPAGEHIEPGAGTYGGPPNNPTYGDQSKANDDIPF